MLSTSKYFLLTVKLSSYWAKLKFPSMHKRRIYVSCAFDLPKSGQVAAGIGWMYWKLGWIRCETGQPCYLIYLFGVPAFPCGSESLYCWGSHMQVNHLFPTPPNILHIQKRLSICGSDCQPANPNMPHSGACSGLSVYSVWAVWHV